MKTIYNSVKMFSVLLCFLTTAGYSQLVYCSQMASSAADDAIFNVTLGSLNNTSNCSTTGGPGSILNRYSDYTSNVPAPNLVIGQNYPLSVTVGQCGSFAYSGIIYVWIDYNQNGVFTDPGENVWTSGTNVWQVAGSQIIAPGGITIPITATPGTTRMRVTAVEGSTSGPCASYFYGETEDYNVNIIGGTPCAGAPDSNAVVTPSYAICPNSSAALSLAFNYTVGGLTYAWMSSTVTPFGPWDPIPTATAALYTAPSLTMNTWFQAVITCSNGPISTTATVGEVTVQPITLSTVPYFEGFEGINANNELPNCSWQRSSLPTTPTYTAPQNQQRFPRTGNKFASFYYTPSGTKYFYSNGIQLDAGVTYSASVWYMTDYYGYNTWTEFSLMLGTSQSPTNLVPIASVSGVVAANIYKSLSDTFSVAVSGIYYVALKGTSNSNCCAYYLSWDDLAIDIPCSLNAPTVAVNSLTNTICAGASLNLTASGADSYMWSNGVNTASVSVSPLTNQNYQVVGTNAITGCTTEVNFPVIVNPSPLVDIAASDIEVCRGQQVNLTAIGANTYAWSDGSINQVISVKPTATTVYSVIGANAYGCKGYASRQIVVNQPPVVSASSDKQQICAGEPAQLTGSGAQTYQWMASTAFIQNNPAIVFPNVSTTYTVLGTDEKGCSASAILSIAVDPCLGLNEFSTLSELRIYPNPNSGLFRVELNGSTQKNIEISDITGRLVFSVSSSETVVDVNISNLANGIYYVKVISDENAQVIKIVKD